MLDIKLLREQPDVVRQGLAKRNPKLSLDEILVMEKERRTMVAGIDNDRAQLNRGSEEFGKQQAQAKGKLTPPPELRQLSDSIKEREQQLKQLEERISITLSYLPNIPHASVPVGDASHNEIVRTVGEKPSYGFALKTHVDLGERLGLFDLARAAKITGSHFPLYRGDGARLERALIAWMLDVHTREHGYTEISPPFLVNRASMFGTGQLPKFEEDLYRLKDDDLFLIPTAEVPVTNLHRDETLDEEQLPICYTAYTPCFRREAGSYGKETKGLVRIHQFDKVELVQFVAPEKSYEAHEQLVRQAETILQRLGLHYRVLCLASGDIGFSAAKCYDLEAWAPGLNQYLEVSSCSNFEDFQARRANIRYRQQSTKKPAFVHTLNGSGLALARTVICLLETYQQADGRVVVPEVLRPYLNGQEVLDGSSSARAVR